MDEAGFETAHIVGNSLGGLRRPAARRARPRRVGRRARARRAAGPPTTGSFRGALLFFRTMQELLRGAPRPHADAILATPEGRRRATEFTSTNFEHIPVELLAHQMRGAARLRRGRADDRVRAARRAGTSMPSGSLAPCG